MVGRRKKLAIWSHELLLHAFTVKTCGLANVTESNKRTKDDAR